MGKIDLHVSSLASEPIQDVLPGRTKNIIDSMDLIELVFAREEGFFGYKFEENAAKAPNIHLFVIVAVSHETFGSPIPPRGDVVGVRSRRVFTFTGAEVG